jgi:hypothetical protein
MKLNRRGFLKAFGAGTGAMALGKVSLAQASEDTGKSVVEETPEIIMQEVTKPSAIIKKNVVEWDSEMSVMTNGAKYTIDLKSGYYEITTSEKFTIGANEYPLPLSGSTMVSSSTGNRISTLLVLVKSNIERLVVPANPDLYFAIFRV